MTTFLGSQRASSCSSPASPPPVLPPSLTSLKRFLSAVVILISGCLRNVSSLSWAVPPSAGGRGCGRITSANRASTSASRTFVLAQCPVALARSLNRRGSRNALSGSLPKPRKSSAGCSREDNAISNRIGMSFLIPAREATDFGGFGPGGTKRVSFAPKWSARSCFWP